MAFSSIRWRWRWRWLPTMHSSRDNIDAGGMISYGPDIIDLFRRAAEFVDNILRGAVRPGAVR